MIKWHVLTHRSLFDWQWYKNSNVSRLFFHCILKANWKDGMFEGISIKRGSFVTSLKALSIELGLSEKQIRTAIDKLIMTNEISQNVTNKYRVITVENYAYYQCLDNFTTSSGQTVGKQKATIEERNKGIKEKEYKDTKVSSSDTSVQRVVEEWNSLSSVGVKQIKKLSSGTKRYESLVARINQYGVDDVIDAIKEIRNSSFLRGGSRKGWCITFDWFVLPNNFIKVLEGNYRDVDKVNQGHRDSQHMNGGICRIEDTYG